MQSLAQNLAVFKDAVETIQAILTSAAIIVGAVWTYKLFEQKRQKFPRAKIEQQVSHRRLRAGEILLSVEVTISNAGDVLLAIESGEIIVMQMLPPGSRLSHLMKESALIEDGTRLTQWDVLGRQSSLKGIEIEPGENQQVFSHFIFGGDLQTVLIRTSIANSRKYRRRLEWQHDTLYDLPSAQLSLQESTHA